MPTKKTPAKKSAKKTTPISKPLRCQNCRFDTTELEQYDNDWLCHLCSRSITAFYSSAGGVATPWADVMRCITYCANEIIKTIKEAR